MHNRATVPAKWRISKGIDPVKFKRHQTSSDKKSTAE
jgi:hypothetical protein